MSDSILHSTKKALGLNKDYTPFDEELILHVNSVLANLRQIGIGPTEGFAITDGTQTWTDLVDDNRLNFVKSYVILRVRMVFDPPEQPHVNQAFQDILKEQEWRLMVAGEGAL